ncbi:MAG: hypothetical protein DSY77_05960 [Bacteroidetes bacterium]|nr:MAG: hypothetical protein DSY77_05960 [Bacteroidota bacterium]
MEKQKELNITVLSKFLETNEIPSIKRQPKTFLEIARQPHYENVISNIYAFYFDPHEEHGLGHLFINSFIECIKEQMQQAKNFLDDFQDFIIDTEYSTEKGGRIDLFLYNDEQAIVVENKIYHNLENDLNDYWKTANKNSRKDSDIVGVLLTLTKHTANLNSQFVNVLHLDFLQKVMANIGNHLMQASDKYVTFLKDLYQNIENMSMQNLSTDDLNFYLNHQQKIVDTVEFEKQVKDHIKTQVVNAFNSFKELKVKKATQNTYQYYSYREIEVKNVKDLYFSVFFHDLYISDKTLWIDIHIKENGPYAKYFDHPEIEKIMKSHAHMQLDKSERKEDGWIYLVDREYTLNSEQMINLEKTVEHFIKKDGFIELFEKLNEKLKDLGKIKS